jgi:Fic family protein
MATRCPLISFKSAPAARLFGWYAALLPTGYSGLYSLQVGAWRTGAIQVVSGRLSREHVHYDAPPAADLDWFNADQGLAPVLEASLAHFWFVTIHPFDDGNGRIARAIADLQLARADGTDQRCYSMSAQIQAERQACYDLLEASQRGPLDVTPWLGWFLGCLGRALQAAEQKLGQVLAKARFWEQHRDAAFTARQRQLLIGIASGWSERERRCRC